MRSAEGTQGRPGREAGYIPALVPRGTSGHQFAIYADSCSGVPGGRHEGAFAQVNRVVTHFRPHPEFILFPGDEIIGLTADMADLKRQWDHWRTIEMGWAGREGIPVYPTTGNHTTYDLASEAVFREVYGQLPRNGPPGQEGLSYSIRHGGLLLVCVNTSWSGLGGEGRVETAWLDHTLASASDAPWKIVAGHHPAFPVNGFSGTYQRELSAENAEEFWDILVRHEVCAYVCSHILAFDVQVHRGVLQIVTAGAGTADRMPPGVEYLHCVQAAVDGQGLRFQVRDTGGGLREWLAWPPQIPQSSTWTPLERGTAAAGLRAVPAEEAALLCWRFTGITPTRAQGDPQTLLHGWSPGPALGPLWIGLLGQENRLCVMLSDAPGRSPHLWRGPELASAEPFDLQIAIHTGMGPGGVIYRPRDAVAWSSLSAASPWGGERLSWPRCWTIGYGQGGLRDRPFRGRELKAWWHGVTVALPEPLA